MIELRFTLSIVVSSTGLLIANQCSAATIELPELTAFGAAVRTTARLIDVSVASGITNEQTHFYQTPTTPQIGFLSVSLVDTSESSAELTGAQGFAKVTAKADTSSGRLTFSASASNGPPLSFSTPVSTFGASATAQANVTDTLHIYRTEPDPNGAVSSHNTHEFKLLTTVSNVDLAFSNIVEASSTLRQSQGFTGDSNLGTVVTNFREDLKIYKDQGSTVTDVISAFPSFKFQGDQVFVDAFVGTKQVSASAPISTGSVQSPLLFDADIRFSLSDLPKGFGCRSASGLFPGCDGIAPPPPPEEKPVIFLDFSTPALKTSIVNVDVFEQQSATEVATSSDTRFADAFSLSDTDKDQIIQAVRQVLQNSGLDEKIIVTTDSAVAAAADEVVTARFSDGGTDTSVRVRLPLSNIDLYERVISGAAYTLRSDGSVQYGVDQFNMAPKGEVAVYVRPDGDFSNFSADRLAVTLVHEVAHTYGAAHLALTSDNPLISTSIMTTRDVADPQPTQFTAEFVSTPSPMDNAYPAGSTHNPLYHIDKFLLDEDSEEAGLIPGSYDINTSVPASPAMIDYLLSIDSVFPLTSLGILSSPLSSALDASSLFYSFSPISYDLSAGMHQFEFSVMDRQTFEIVGSTGDSKLLNISFLEKGINDPTQDDILSARSVSFDGNLLGLNMSSGAYFNSGSFSIRVNSPTPVPLISSGWFLIAALGVGGLLHLRSRRLLNEIARKV